MSKNENELLKKAELLLKLRDYQKESLHQGEGKIDIKATKSETGETVLVRMITESKLKSDGVGIEEAKNTVQSSEKNDIDKVILLGTEFTEAAKRFLSEHDVEFFRKKKRITSSLNLQELSLKIHDSMDKLCQLKCSQIPLSESDCEGFYKGLVECPYCKGNGKLDSSYRNYKCPFCYGGGKKKKHYSCMVRLISDNADLHFEHGWITLLQNDLISLLEILRTLKVESKEDTLMLTSFQ